MCNKWYLNLWAQLRNSCSFCFLVFRWNSLWSNDILGQLIADLRCWQAKGTFPLMPSCKQSYIFTVTPDFLILPFLLHLLQVSPLKPTRLQESSLSVGSLFFLFFIYNSVFPVWVVNVNLDVRGDSYWGFHVRGDSDGDSRVKQMRL